MKKLNIMIMALSLLVPIYADANDKQTESIKYLLSIDYPTGVNAKQTYLEWVKSNVPVLQSYPEVKNIISYDNYYGVNPHRLVEFYFTDMQSAGRYWSYPKVRKVLQDLSNHSGVAKVNIFIKRGEYQHKRQQK